MINQRREQSKGCALEAQQAGRAAHDASLHGLNRRELGIRQSPTRYSLREAERLQQAFIKSLKESKDLEDLAQDGERNIWKLCQQMAELSRQRADLSRTKEHLEQNVASIAVNLRAYKLKKEAEASAAKMLREEVRRYEELCRRAEIEADKAEAEAEKAAQEAARLRRHL